MDEFYLAMGLNHDRECPGCGERVWVVYGDGHVWDDCLKCDYRKNSLDLAGYITRYPVPQGPVPDGIEYKDLPDKDRRFHQEHEYRAYRKLSVHV